MVRRMGLVPEVGSCADCGKTFIVPLNALKNAKDADANLRHQFAQHLCKELSEVQRYFGDT